MSTIELATLPLSRDELPGWIPAPSGDAATDTANLRAAITLAVVGGAGTVVAQEGIYELNDLVTVPDGVQLWGQGNSLYAGRAATVFQCTTAGAGIAIEGSGGVCRDFCVDGNHVANKPFSRGTQPSSLWPGSQRTFISIDAMNSARDNFTLYASQNDLYASCNMADAARDNMYIDQGAGGHTFIRLEVTNPGRYNLRIDNAVAGGPYTDGCADITFIHGIFERVFSGATSAIYTKGAVQIRFYACTAYGVACSGPLVDIHQDSIVHWDSGLVTGGLSMAEEGMKVGPNSTLTISGAPSLNYLGTVLHAAAADAFIRINGEPITSHISGNYVQADGGAALEWNISDVLSLVPRVFWSGGDGTGIILSNVFGTANRWRVTANGAMSYYNGANLYPSGTDLLKSDKDIQARRLVSARATQTLASNGAVTIDASAGDTQVVTLQANATSSSITNAVAGQRLALRWVQDATGGRTYVWPANWKFANGNTPSPATTANTWQSSIAVYDGTNWNEIGAAGGGDGGWNITDGAGGRPGLQNSWTGLGSGYSTPAYRRDATGRVQLKGLLTGGTATSGTVIFTLPAGYRPAENKVYEVACAGAVEVRVMSNGNVQIGSLTNADAISYLSLDSIDFIAEQ